MSPRRTATHVPLTAVLLIVCSVAFFSATEMVVKLLTQRYSTGLLLWGRFAGQALIIALLLAPTMRFRLVATQRLHIQLSRSIALIVASALYYQALRTLPLADATAIIYTAPVLVILLSIAFLNERMTRPRLAFVVSGFLGMLLIIRPGMSILQGAAFLVLLSALLYSAFQVWTRSLQGDDPRVTLFYPALLGTIVTTPFVLVTEQSIAMPWRDVGLLFLVGALGTTGHFMFIRAFRSAPASALTPFTYSQLVWATMFGLVAFGQFPDGFALAGIALIAGSGVLLAWHERRSAQGALALREPIAVE